MMIICDVFLLRNDTRFKKKKKCSIHFHGRGTGGDISAGVTGVIYDAICWSLVFV